MRKDYIKGIITGVLLCVLITTGLAASLSVTGVITDLKLFVNGKQIDKEIVSINGSSYLPVRAIGEALNLNVAYDGSARRIDITPKDQTAVKEPESQSTTPTGSLDSNSRTNPAGINETYRLSIDDFFDGKATIELTLLETISGSQAWGIVYAANQFNDQPNSDEEYILAKFRVSVLSTEDDKPYDMNHAKFKVISENGVMYDDFVTVSGLDPDLSTNLYSGATHEGWTYFKVKKDDNPVAVFGQNYDWEVWFSLR